MISSIGEIGPDPVSQLQSDCSIFNWIKVGDSAERTSTAVGNNTSKGSRQ